MSGEVCWVLERDEGSSGKRYRGCGRGVGKCVGVWGEVRKDVWAVEKCGRVYGVSGEVCWHVGKGCGEKNGGSVGKCVGVWGPNTLRYCTLRYCTTLRYCNKCRHVRHARIPKGGARGNLPE